jgi:hypothetical protein
MDRTDSDATNSNENPSKLQTPSVPERPIERDKDSPGKVSEEGV